MTATTAHTWRELLLLEPEGDTLLTTCPSRSAPGVWWHQRTPTGAGAPVCDCRGFRAHGHCHHAEAAEDLRRAYRETRAVQAAMDLDFLRLQAEYHHPDNHSGRVTLVWVAAQHTLAERLRAREVAA